MKDHTITDVKPGTSTIEPCGATDDIRYVLNEVPPPVQAPMDNANAGGDKPAGAGGLADNVIDNVDAQLPDQTDSTVRGGKVAQESKRGAY